MSRAGLHGGSLKHATMHDKIALLLLLVLMLMW
jgi:hypothetical protein